MDIKILKLIVQDAAFEVRNTLPVGFLERVYHNALMFELASRGLKVESEKEIQIYYKGQNVGTYRADLIVDDQLIIELKCVSILIDAHYAQLINYLTATGIPYGALINYGHNFECKFKDRDYIPRSRR